MKSGTCEEAITQAERERLNAYCGFARGFTGHDWCQQFYVGRYLDDGRIERCDCPCHGPKSGSQGVLQFR